ncbi:hypothetical protein MTO96_006920 [Rhipicephalus appendiculatus]
MELRRRRRHRSAPRPAVPERSGRLTPDGRPLADPRSPPAGTSVNDPPPAKMAGVKRALCHPAATGPDRHGWSASRPSRKLLLPPPAPVMQRVARRTMEYSLSAPLLRPHCV